MVGNVREGSRRCAKAREDSANVRQGLLSAVELRQDLLRSTVLQRSTRCKKVR